MHLKLAYKSPEILSDTRTEVSCKSKCSDDTGTAGSRLEVVEGGHHHNLPPVSPSQNVIHCTNGWSLRLKVSKFNIFYPK